MMAILDRLKKLFSSPVILKNVNGKIRVVDTDHFQSSGNPYQTKVIDRYGRLHGSRGANVNPYHQYNGFSAARLDLYTDYEAMDEDALISSALDIYADECTTKSETGDILIIKSQNENIRKILRNLFYDIMNVQYNIWPWTRNLCKYGDFYLFLDVKEELGVISVFPMSTYEVTREEGVNPEDLFETKFIYEGPLGKGKFDNHEIAHFRLLSDTNFLPYGKSILEGARKLFKQLCLPEYTKIWTPTGYKTIGDIEIGDTVYSFDYNLNIPVETTLKNKMFTGVRPTYRIQTSHRQIDASAEHPFLMADGKYKTVMEMTTNDDIVISDLSLSKNDDIKYPCLTPSNVGVMCNFDDEYFENKVKPLFSGVCLECGNVFGRLTGNHLKSAHDIRIEEYYKNNNINEQCVAFLNRNIRITIEDAHKMCSIFNLDISKLNLYGEKSSKSIIPEDTIRDNFKSFVRFFGFMLGDGWIYDNTVAFSLGSRLDKSEKYIEFLNKIGASPTISEDGTPRAYCRVHSSYFVDLMKTLGFQTGTHNKKVPDWIYNLPIEYQNEFLFGMVDADGMYMNNGGFARISNSNKKLIEDMILISQQCGNTTSRMHTSNFDGEHGYNNTVMYTFQFKPEKTHLTKIVDGKFVEKIKSIEQIDDQPLYDIEVDNALHNFIAEGVVAHNCLMEDAMMIHRVMRAPEKRIFKIDIGNIPPNEVDQYMKSVMNEMKKTPFIDQKTGQYNLRYNMQNILEDFYLPVRGQNNGTEISTLNGLQYQAIDDLQYLLSKLFASLKIPKAFLGYDETVEGKATLAAEDIRFARTVERIQRIVESELTKIAIIHLFAQGFKEEDLINFSLHLTSPSIIYEQEKINLLKQKVEVFSLATENHAISKWNLYKNIFNMSEDEANEEINNIIEDAKFKFRIAQIETEGNDPVVTSESFGTPHDIASMELPKKEGRPKEYKSTYETDEHPMGRDPLGKKAGSDIKMDKKPNHSYRGSAISTESADKYINYLGSVKFKTNDIIKKSLLRETVDHTLQSENSTELIDNTFLNEKNIIDEQ